jgi:hypothetical protein
VRRERSDRILAVLRGVANIVLSRPLDGRKALAQGIDHLGRVVHGKGRLGDKGEGLGIADRQGSHISLVLYEIHFSALGAIELTQRAFHLRVPLMADENAFPALAAEFHDLHVHLGHEGTGGIEDLKLPSCGGLLHPPGHAMGTEDHHRIIGDFLELIDKARAALAEIFDHGAVVHHLMAHVDRRAKGGEGALHNVDGSIYPGAEPSGVSQLNLHPLQQLGIHGLTLLHRFHGDNGYLKGDRTPRKGMIEVHHNLIVF